MVTSGHRSIYWIKNHFCGCDNQRCEKTPSIDHYNLNTCYFCRLTIELRLIAFSFSNFGLIVLSQKLIGNDTETGGGGKKRYSHIQSDSDGSFAYCEWARERKMVQKSHQLIIFTLILVRVLSVCFHKSAREREQRRDCVYVIQFVASPLVCVCVIDVRFIVVYLLLFILLQLDFFHYDANVAIIGMCLCVRATACYVCRWILWLARLLAASWDSCQQQRQQQ